MKRPPKIANRRDHPNVREEKIPQEHKKETIIKIGPAAVAMKTVLKLALTGKTDLNDPHLNVEKVGHLGCLGLPVLLGLRVPHDLLDRRVLLEAKDEALDRHAALLIKESIYILPTCH